MLTFNNLKEMKPHYIKETSTYVFKDDITINFTLNVDANIDAWNIDAEDINAEDINAWNINAGNIDALDINARDIKYWAFCIARQSFKCRSAKGKRENSIHKCLDREIEFVKD